MKPDVSGPTFLQLGGYYYRPTGYTWNTFALDLFVYCHILIHLFYLFLIFCVARFSIMCVDPLE